MTRLIDPYLRTLQVGSDHVTLHPAMFKKKKWFSLLLLPLLLTGCPNSTITNLTATQQPRNETGQYLIELKLDTTQQTLRPESITPHVVVGFDAYPMRPQLKMVNRWEALVPIPAGTNVINYHFKIDYE